METLQEATSDSQIAKHFSMFLTELGSVGSKLLVPHLSKLAEDLLNVEVSRGIEIRLLGPGTHNIQLIRFFLCSSVTRRTNLCTTINGRCGYR